VCLYRVLERSYLFGTYSEDSNKRTSVYFDIMMEVDISPTTSPDTDHQHSQTDKDNQDDFDQQVNFKSFEYSKVGYATENEVILCSILLVNYGQSQDSVYKTLQQIQKDADNYIGVLPIENPTWKSPWHHRSATIREIREFMMEAVSKKKGYIYPVVRAMSTGFGISVSTWPITQWTNCLLASRSNKNFSTLLLDSSSHRSRFLHMLPAVANYVAEYGDKLKSLILQSEDQCSLEELTEPSPLKGEVMAKNRQSSEIIISLKGQLTAEETKCKKLEEIQHAKTLSHGRNRERGKRLAKASLEKETKSLKQDRHQVKELEEQLAASKNQVYVWKKKHSDLKQAYVELDQQLAEKLEEKENEKAILLQENKALKERISEIENEKCIIEEELDDMKEIDNGDEDSGTMVKNRQHPFEVRKMILTLLALGVAASLVVPTMLASTFKFRFKIPQLNFVRTMRQELRIVVCALAATALANPGSEKDESVWEDL